MNEIKKIAVLTSGGDAPGMNSAVRAVVFSANNLGIEVVGVLRGYEGLIDWEAIPLGLDDVRNINNQGGTILFTSRSERFLDQKYRHTAAENLRAHDVDAVVAIGGDGTLRGAIKFKDEGVNIVCIPGTIDRDVACSEYTLGFDTAAPINRLLRRYTADRLVPAAGKGTLYGIMVETDDNTGLALNITQVKLESN